MAREKGDESGGSSATVI
jgi:hypothetical protein